MKDCLQCAGLDLRFQANRFSKLQADLHSTDLADKKNVIFISPQISMNASSTTCTIVRQTLHVLMSRAFSVVIAFLGSSGIAHMDIAKVSNWRKEHFSYSMPVTTYNFLRFGNINVFRSVNGKMRIKVSVTLYTYSYFEKGCRKKCT